MTVTQVVFRKKVVTAEQNSAQRDFIICSHIREPIKNPLTIIRSFFGRVAGRFQKLFQEFHKILHFRTLFRFPAVED